MTRRKLPIPGLVALSWLLFSVSGWALEPQTLFNFQLGLGPVGGALIEPPDGNFYGTAGFFAQDSNNIGIDEASFPFSGQWF
jgi:hypothetical protein